MLIYTDNTGIIEISRYDTADEAIRQGKIIIREYAKCKSVYLVGLKIIFADKTSAVWNSIQKSECLKQ